MCLQIILGQVVFAAGGVLDTAAAVSQVELYSPDGNCQHVLTPLPVPVNGIFLVLFNGSVVACSGHQNKVSINKLLFQNLKNYTRLQRLQFA